MSGDWISIVAAGLEQSGAAVLVSVISAEGSTPREVGAWMLVYADHQEQTIGGGQLEYDAVDGARKMLAQRREVDISWQRQTHHYPLGPALGQCCGGSTRLLFELFTPREHNALRELASSNRTSGLIIRQTVGGSPLLLATARKHGLDLPVPVAFMTTDMLSGARPRDAIHLKLGKDDDTWFIEPAWRAAQRLYIYGAGHVGRAIVTAINGLNFETIWVDTTPQRFPEHIPEHALPAIVVAPEGIARTAQANAFHLVLTFSHSLDLAICHALLARNDFSFLGLIGSRTKRNRFLKRLREAGINDAALSRLTCPIDISSIRGKEPASIAIAVSAQLTERLEQMNAVAATSAGRDHGTTV